MHGVVLTNKARAIDIERVHQRMLTSELTSTKSQIIKRQNHKTRTEVTVPPETIQTFPLKH